MSATPSYVEIVEILRESRARLAMAGELRGNNSEMLLRIDQILAKIPGTPEWAKLHPAA